MKKLQTYVLPLITIIVLTVSMQGCGTGSAQRVAIYEQAIAEASQVSEALDQRLEGIAVMVEATQAALADPNVSSEAATEFSSVLEKVQAELLRLAPIKDTTDAMLQDLQARLVAIQADGAVDLQAEAGLVGQVLTSTGAAVPGNAGIYMTLAGLVLTNLATYAAGARKTNQAVVKQTAAEAGLSQTVKGIDKAKLAGAIEIGKFTVAMDSKQSHATRDMVDVIQGKAA